VPAYQPPVSAPGLVSIDPLTGIIVTSIGIVVQYDGFSTARIWIPLAYRGCVSGRQCVPVQLTCLDNPSIFSDGLEKMF